MRSRLHELESQRDEAIRLLAMLDVEPPPLRRKLSRQQADSIAGLLKTRLLDAPKKPLQRRYVRGLVSGIVVDRERAVITGPEKALAAEASSGNLDGDEVRTSVWDWRALGESNPSCKIENLES